MSGPNCHLLLRPMGRSLLNHRSALTSNGAARSISTSSACLSNRNFRKFPIPNKRGMFEYPKLPIEFRQKEYKDAVITTDDMKIRWPGVWFSTKFAYVREMEPELIVPHFEDCPLKPYVSYKSEEITQSEFTSKELFNVTYGADIVKKFEKKQAIPEEYLNYDAKAQKDAKNNALKVGADLFSQDSYFGSIDLVWRYHHNSIDDDLKGK